MSQQLLTASRIFGVVDLKEVVEEIPEWPGEDGEPGHIRLREMMAEKSLELADKMVARPNDGVYLALIYSAVDEEGKLLFTEEDLPKLRQKSLVVLNRLQHVILGMNRMDRASGVALKKV